MSVRPVLLKRELRGWFLVPGHYVLAAVFLAGAGLAFWFAAVPNMGHPVPTARVLFGSLLFWMMIVGVAAVSGARGAIEDRASGAFDLLLSAPVSEADIVAAKLGGVLVWLGLLLLAPIAYLPILRLFDPGLVLDGGLLAAGYLAILLVAGVTAAIGLLAALVVPRFAAAAGVAFTVSGLLWFSDHFVGAQPGAAADLAGGLAVNRQIGAIAAGWVDSRPVVAALLAIGVLAFTAVRLLEWQRYRRPAAAWNAVAAIGLAVLLAVLVNLLASRHHVRFDWTRSGVHTLAERSLVVARGLSEPVRVAVITETHHPVAEELRRLLAAYTEANSAVSVETVATDRDMARVRELAVRFGLKEGNVVVIESGERSTLVPFKRLTAAASGGQAGAGAALGPQAEQVLTSAIYWITRPGSPTVYFLTGHGERAPDDYDPQAGYAAAARRMQQDGLSVRSIALNDCVSISNETAVLVVAGPTRAFSDTQLGMLRDYLARGGRMLFMLDAGIRTGIEDLLREWGVRLEADAVVARRVGGLIADGRAEAGRAGGEIAVTRYSSHPVTRRMGDAITTFYRPRSVAPARPQAEQTGAVADRVDKPRVSVLALSPDQAWAERDLSQSPAVFDEGFDRPGPVPIAVGVEKGIRSGIDVELRPTRIVVIGDAQFAANGGLAGGNADFLMNCIGWLLDQERLIAIPERARTLFDVRLTHAGKLRAFAAIVGGLPALALAAGALVAVLRRDRREVRPGKGGAGR